MPKAWREKKREREKLKKEQIVVLPILNAFNDRDLTPHNASMVARQNELTKVCFGPEIKYK